MEMYGTNKLYEMDDDIDEFGVNHSNFSLRDELEYNQKIANKKQNNGDLETEESFDNTGTQYAQNEYTNTANDGTTNNQDEIFNRVINKTFGEEGGYEDDSTKIDTPTNMGIQQKTLDNFKSQHPDLSSGYPANVNDLSKEQAIQIARKDFFDPYRIGEINNSNLQETMFDTFFNHTPQGPALWAQKAINQNTDMNVDEDGIFGSQTINALNNLSSDEIKNVNNFILDQREKDYYRQLKTNNNPNYKNYSVGLPNRFNRFRMK